MAVTSESRALQHRLCGLGLTLVFIGGAGVGGLMVAQRRIAQTSQWPSVTGKIVTSEVVTGTVKNGRTLIVSPHAKADYSYAVNGKSYRGENRRVVSMLHFDSEGTPEQVVAKYPVGRSVTVYYDPNNPADALLTPVPEQSAKTLISSLWMIAPLVGGVGLLIAGIAGLILWRTRDLAPNVKAAATMAPAILPTTAVALTPPPKSLTAPPKPPRANHWIVRAVATLLGLGLFLFGTLLTITMAKMDRPDFGQATVIVTWAIFGGVVLFGVFLIWVGIRRPHIAIPTA